MRDPVSVQSLTRTRIAPSLTFMLGALPIFFGDLEE